METPKGETLSGGCGFLMDFPEGTGEETQPALSPCPLSIPVHSTSDCWHHAGAPVSLSRICLLVWPEVAMASPRLRYKSL